jgi:hypothetical protein
MTKPQLSAPAIADLKLVAGEPGALPYAPALPVLWNIRYVIGEHQRTHITQPGQAFVTALMANEPTAERSWAGCLSAGVLL